jgi:hypothetical protein
VLAAPPTRGVCQQEEFAATSEPVSFFLGVRTFNGDGTGSATYNVMGIERSFNPSAPGFGDAYSVKLTWSFTYKVEGDTWTTDVASGTLVSGIFTGGPMSV